jgi:hypothetical protein
MPRNMGYRCIRARDLHEPRAGIFPSHVKPGRRVTTLKHAVRPRQNMLKSDSIIAMPTLPRANTNAAHNSQLAVRQSHLALPYKREHLFRPLAQSHAVGRKHARPAGTIKQLDAQPPVPKRHIHHAAKGGGQVLICGEGEGWYQEEGKPAQSLVPGDIVEIPANVKHWHGAKAGCWFSRPAFDFPGEDCSNEWLEPVTEEAYNALEA